MPAAVPPSPPWPIKDIAIGLLLLLTYAGGGIAAKHSQALCYQPWIATPVVLIVEVIFFVSLPGYSFFVCKKKGRPALDCFTHMFNDYSRNNAGGALCGADCPGARDDPENTGSFVQDATRGRACSPVVAKRRILARYPDQKEQYVTALSKKSYAHLILKDPSNAEPAFQKVLTEGRAFNGDISKSAQEGIEWARYLRGEC
jgi:hypothetical protein